MQGEKEGHLSPFGTVLRRWSVSDVVAGKYDLGLNPPPAPPLGNKTDPDPPLSILPPTPVMMRRTFKPAKFFEEPNLKVRCMLRKYSRNIKGRHRTKCLSSLQYLSGFLCNFYARCSHIWIPPPPPKPPIISLNYCAPLVTNPLLLTFYAALLLRNHILRQGWFSENFCSKLQSFNVCKT